MTLCGFWWVLVDCDRSFPAAWCSVVLFVVHHSVWGYVTWKDSWRERHTHHARRRKSVASDAALAWRSYVAASASGRISQRMTNKLVEQICSNSASFKQMCTQMPRMLFVPRVDVVRKCSFICSEQDKANKTTRPPTLNVFVAEGEESRPSDLRRGSMKHSSSQATHTELQSHASKQ